MANAIYDWSTTAASNASADATVNWAENMPPDGVNDSARAMMVRIAAFLDDLAPTRASTGTGNAYAVTSAVGASAYSEGEIVSFIADRACTGGGCTLNSGARGAVAFRPKSGTEFNANDIITGQWIVASYRAGSNEFIALGSGYPASSLAAGLSVQSIVGRLPQIGDMVLSMDSTPATGRIRLTESTQTLNKADWPDLNTWLASKSYPWGSASTTFNLPPAAGYFLRFAPTSTGVDPDGARAAGATQADAVASHTHGVGTLAGTTNTTGAHTHIYGPHPIRATISAAGSGAQAFENTGTADALTSSNGDHSHTVSLTGATATNGATTETRPKNVAFYVDIIASTSTVSVGSTPVGYATGAGGTVTQATSKSTGVTLNKTTGRITMNAASLAAGTTVGFVLTNSIIADGDIPVVAIKSGGTANSYHVQVSAVTNGACTIEVRNTSGGALAEALVLNFGLIRGQAS